MAYKTIYSTVDGTILRSTNINADQLSRYLASNPNTAALDGLTRQPSKKVVDLDTLTVVDKTITWNMPVYIRQEREWRLYSSDWTQGADSPLTDAKKAEWATYRQALRDLPATSTATTPEDVVWPSQPS